MRPEHNKEFCRSIAPDGWTYVGWDDGYYMFQSGNYSSGFKLMECLYEDLTLQNLALMARLGVTRDRKFKG